MVRAAAPPGWDGRVEVVDDLYDAAVEAVGGGGGGGGGGGSSRHLRHSYLHYLCVKEGVQSEKVEEAYAKAESGNFREHVYGRYLKRSGRGEEAARLLVEAAPGGGEGLAALVQDLGECLKEGKREEVYEVARDSLMANNRTREVS